MIPARDALPLLREGNQRFISDARRSDDLLNHARRSQLTVSQEPFAIVLGCSDSRVPSEIVFDRASVDHLRHGSEVLEQLIRHEGVLVVGAEYSLETGEVTFFDGVPD